MTEPQVSYHKEWERTYYNVYRIVFDVMGNERRHVGIALISESQPLQLTGWLYHVIGEAGEGMKLERRQNFDFGTRKVESQLKKYRIKKSDLRQWDSIAHNIKPPHDLRVLEKWHEFLKEYPNPSEDELKLWRCGKDLDPPAPNCVSWTDEVLKAGRDLAVPEPGSGPLEQPDFKQTNASASASHGETSA